jgi:hypothetical protein
MANGKSEEGAKSTPSLADIAATLITQPNAAAEAEQEDIDENVNEDEVPTGEDSDDALEAVAEEPDETEAEPSETDEGEEQEGDDQPDDEPDTEDEPEYFDISDDDLITVVVDGEEQELSIGELKKAHSLGGATEKRLQEATEMRKAAHAERTQMLEKLADQERLLTQALSDLDDSVFTPVIPEPPADLKRTDPARYLQHQEAYQQDQERISKARQAIEGKLNTLQQQRNERLKEYADEAGKVIVQQIPELADEKSAPAMLSRLVETAKSYGYTDQEINTALDPRMFLLVRDAMQYRDMQAKNKERPNVKKLEGQNTKKVRRLRSGSASTAQARARQKDKDRQKVVEKARQTGKVQDVAATLLTSRG